MVSLSSSDVPSGWIILRQEQPPAELLSTPFISQSCVPRTKKNLNRTEVELSMNVAFATSFPTILAMWERTPRRAGWKSFPLLEFPCMWGWLWVVGGHQGLGRKSNEWKRSTKVKNMKIRLSSKNRHGSSRVCSFVRSAFLLVVFRRGNQRHTIAALHPIRSA